MAERGKPGEPTALTAPSIAALPAEDAPSIGIGQRLGVYEVVPFIGAGGMGEVYRAHDTRLDRDVALKVLTAHLSSDTPGAHERFRREARAVAALSHPNICTIHDVGDAADGHTFLVMELLQGETLQQRLQRGP